jgi:hypothetical protein
VAPLLVGIPDLFISFAFNFLGCFPHDSVVPQDKNIMEKGHGRRRLFTS